MAHKGFIGSNMVEKRTMARISYNVFGTIPQTAVRPIPRILRTLTLPAGLMEASANPGSIMVGGAVGDGTGRRWLQGIIKEAGVPVSRVLTVHRRDTKGIVARASSMLNGHFTVSWQGYGGKVFLVVFDDTTIGPDYNCQIVDLVDSIS